MLFAQLYHRLSQPATFNSRAVGRGEEGSPRRLSKTIRYVKTVQRWLEKHRELFKDYMQIIAILVAASWAIYQFYYIEIYKPQHAKPVVTMTVTVEFIGKNETTIMLMTKVTLHNRGNAPVSVISCYGNVYAVAVNSVGVPDVDAFD